MRYCSIEGCNEKHHGNGLCRPHYMKEYSEKNEEKIKKSQKEYRKERVKSKTKEYSKLKQKEYRLRTKIQVFSHYSNGFPICVNCGEDDLSKLTIHHPNDNGKEERKTTGMGSNFYSWLKANDFPDNGYQIMCFSCNCSERINDKHVKINCNRVNVYKNLTHILYTDYIIRCVKN